MFALLIKPAAMRKRAHREFISRLKTNGAHQLLGHDVQSLRAELISLTEQHDEVTLLACGGDGTVNLAINSAINLPIKFTVIPMGTGNDFARHIGVGNLQIAQSMLDSNEVIQSDLGEIELSDGTIKYFAAVASCGFDAQVNERANRISGPNGPAKYLASVFGELKDLSSLKLRLKYNQQDCSGKFMLIAIANTSSYGGGMKIAPSADLTDGHFALTIVDDATRRTLVRVLPKVFSGKHVYHPKVAVDAAAEIFIDGDSYPIYADGERMGVGPANFKVLPARLALMVPSGI